MIKDIYHYFSRCFLREHDYCFEDLKTKDDEYIILQCYWCNSRKILNVLTGEILR